MDADATPKVDKLTLLPDAPRLVAKSSNVVLEGVEIGDDRADGLAGQANRGEVIVGAVEPEATAILED